MITGMWQRSWSWRASLAWALLGPAFVLLVEVESTLVVINGLGGVRLPRELRGWQTLIAGAVLVLLIAAQLSATLWRRLGSARRDLSERRALEEGKLADKAHGVSTSTSKTADDAQASSGVDQNYVAFPALHGMRSLQNFTAAILPTRKLKRLASDFTQESGQVRGARRIIERFGLEPSWAFQQLDENLEAPAARRLTGGARLADARWAGHATAFVFAVMAITLLYVWAVNTPHGVGPTPVVALTVVLVVLMLGQLAAVAAAGRVVVLNETQFYPQVEALLELHRFDLYRALAVPSPRDSKEEQKGGISAWRLGSGRVAFEQGETRDDDVRQQVAGLAELLQGPELVAYDGFVSWRADDEQVELAFAHTPVLTGGYARLQVSGSRTASHAPFDITADSDDVALAQVRVSVSAPVGEGTARTTFDFQRPAAAQEPPELWFEISQRGRFIQLLRVKAPRPSSQQNAQ